MMHANPYLNFAGNTLDAFTFYREVFGGEFQAVMRYRDFPGNAMGLSEDELDLVAHVALPLADATLMGTDHVPSFPKPFVAGNNTYVALEADSVAEAERVFGALSVGGEVEMPLQPTEWAEQYGSLTDRFGIQWMVMFTGQTAL